MTVNLAALKEPFPADHIEWRLQSSGEKNGKVWAICLAYVTNRAIMDRLDDVVGPGNWKNEFREGPGGGVLCGISIRIDGEWVCKWDGAENTDVEAVKGGLSGASKRAAVQWGIGRYLYDLEEGFAVVTENGKLRGKTKNGTTFRWNPPALPAWALPGRRDPVQQVREAVEPKNAEMEPLIGFITTAGPQVPEDAELLIGGKVVNLKAYVREHWAAIKAQPRTARTVVDAIERATGTEFAAAE